MLRLFLAQRLIGLLMTLVIGGAAWFLFGKDILDDLREDTARQEGLGPRSERIYQRSQFEPALQALRDEVGPNARVFEVSLRADRLEFQVRSRGEEAVFVGEDGNYDDLDRDENAVITVPASSSYSLRRVDAGAPQRLVERIERLEDGEFRTTQLRLLLEGGKLGWTAHGRIDQRGVGYYSDARGRRVVSAADRFTP